MTASRARFLLAALLVGLALPAAAETIPGATSGAGTGSPAVGAGPAPGTPSGVVGFDGPPGGPANVTGGAGTLPPGAPPANTGLPAGSPASRN